MLDAAPAPRVSARRSGSRRRWWYRPETAGDLGLPDPVPHAPPMDAEFPMDAELVGDLFDRARARRRVPADIHRSTISATAHGRRAAIWSSKQRGGGAGDLNGCRRKRRRSTSRSGRVWAGGSGRRYRSGGAVRVGIAAGSMSSRMRRSLQSRGQCRRRIAGGGADCGQVE